MAGMGASAPGHVHLQRRGACYHQTIGTASAATGSLPDGNAGAVQRIFSRLLASDRRGTQPADVEHPQSAHAEPGWNSQVALGRPTVPPLIDFRYFDPAND